MLEKKVMTDEEKINVFNQGVTEGLSAYNTPDTAGNILKDAQKKAKGAYLNTI